MTNWNIFSIDLIRFGIGQFLRLDMSGKLMTEEVEINPFVGASADFAAQEIAVELAGFFDITNRESQVKGFKFAHID